MGDEERGLGGGSREQPRFLRTAVDREDRLVSVGEPGEVIEGGILAEGRSLPRHRRTGSQQHDAVGNLLHERAPAPGKLRLIHRAGERWNQAEQQEQSQRSHRSSAAMT